MWPGEHSPPFHKAVLVPSPESYQFPNPLRQGGVVEQETTLVCLKPTETVFFAQEFQALKVAMEENLSPALSFPNELNFTKCTQAVSALKDVLSATCKNQWDHLQGKEIDEQSYQEIEEGLCSSSPLPRGHPSMFCPARIGGRCLQAPWPPREHWPLSLQPWKLQGTVALCCTVPVWAYSLSLRFYDFFHRDWRGNKQPGS